MPESGLKLVSRLLCLSFPGGSDDKKSACNAGDTGSISGLGRSPGEGNGNPLQYSCLENPQGQRSLVGYSPQGCKESDTTERLSTAQLGFLSGSAVRNPPARQEMQKTRVGSLDCEDHLKEGMATHFTILPWKIAWTEEPGGLQSTGSQRIRHD